MHFTTFMLMPLVALLPTAILASPLNNQAHQASLLITINSFDSSSSADIELAASCGRINGNCYENGCEGQFSPDRQTCTQGTRSRSVDAYYIDLFSLTLCSFAVV